MEAGYLDEVVGVDAVLDRGLAEAARLATLPADAYARTKRKLREATVRHIETTLAADMASVG